MERLIALYSPRPGCGKSSVARALFKQGWSVLSFAWPMRRVIITFLEECGIPPEQGELLVNDPALKEMRLERVPGHPTPRHLLRTLGTEWGRDCVTQSLWVEMARARARKVLERQSAAGVVFDDLRFPNEAEMIRQEQGLLVRLDRPQAPPLTVDHPSDSALEKERFDERVCNDSDDLERVDTIASRLMAIAYGMLKPKGEDGWSGPKAYRSVADHGVEGLFIRGHEQEWRRMPANAEVAS
jgi:hypothetical protein